MIALDLAYDGRNLVDAVKAYTAMLHGVACVKLQRFRGVCTTLPLAKMARALQNVAVPSHCGPLLVGGQERNLVPQFRRLEIGGPQRECAQILFLREESAVDCLNEVVGTRAFLPALTAGHAQIERTTALEAAMLPRAQLPAAVAVPRRDDVVRTP